MKAFITGMSGFAGSHLRSYLISKKFEVSGIGTKERHEHADYEKANLLDFESLKKSVGKIKPDIIFHLAGISSVKRCLDSPELCKNVNEKGTENLLNAVAATEIRPKIIVAGSAEVYGLPKKVPIKESHPLAPANPYAKTKLEQERICQKFRDELDIVILRLFPHIGPGQKPDFVASDFARQIAEIEKGKQPVMTVGNLKAERDFTDVRDIAVAYRLAAEKALPEHYNVCSGNVKSIKEILDLLLSMSKVKISVEADKSKMRPSDIPVLAGDNSKFCSQTGWKPKIPIENTLNDLLAYWRSNIK